MGTICAKALCGKELGTDEEWKGGQHDWRIMRERVAADETGERRKTGTLVVSCK